MSSSQEYKSQTHLPRIGILGDGQLAKMMTESYQQLGGEVFVFGSSPSSPASAGTDQFFLGDAENADELFNFFNSVDLVTLENEFIDSQLLAQVSELSNIQVLPDPKQYLFIEDKLSEKRFFESLDIEIADFFEVNTTEDLVDEPGFLKLAKGGYDGIGTYKVDNRQQAIDVFERIKDSGTVLFEHAVDYQKELSMIAVANSADIVFYPMVETYQENGTCRYVAYPSGISEDLEELARNKISRVMKSLNTRGLFAFEFFMTKDNRLILNESAPRPHNSGHITLDLMDCSQFENHMRAVADMALKQPKLIKPSALMVNLLGTRNGEFDEQKVISNINDDNLNIKLYGKKQSRIKRKMGHINLWGNDQWQRAEQLVKTLEI